MANVYEQIRRFGFREPWSGGIRRDWWYSSGVFSRPKKKATEVKILRRRDGQETRVK